MYSGNRFRNFTLLAAALALLPALADAQSRSTFRCTGNDGKKYYGNTVPPQCYGRLVEQLNAQGMVIKRMDPDANVNDKDLETKAAEKAAKEKYDAANRETQRRNRALLATYTSEKDIEEQRGRALSDNQKTVREIEQRVTDLKKRRASFDKELEFYQDKKGAPAKVPPKLQEEIRQAEFDLKVQQDSLETKKKEVSSINAKYDDDRRRYLELSGKSGAPRAAK
jgi:chromosome segregation ATPase